MNSISPTSIISVRDLRRSYSSTKKDAGWRGTWKQLTQPEKEIHEALKGVSFDIEAGAFVGLIGANGAGKTTLLKILSGLIAPSSGTARVINEDPFERSLGFRNQLALVMGQKAQLWWDLPAIDAFDLLQAIYNIPLATYRERLDTLSKLLDVERLMKTQIRRLSLGERMKMELIGALLHWPRVIFLDEPTIGLDVVAAAKLRDFLREFNRREKATIILTSHNMEDIERLCSRVLILREGTLIYDGTPKGLTSQEECRLRVRIASEPSNADLAKTLGIEERTVEADPEHVEGEAKLFHLTLTNPNLVPILQKVMANYKLVDMGIEEPGLDRVIQRLFGGASP